MTDNNENVLDFDASKPTKPVIGAMPRPNFAQMVARMYALRRIVDEQKKQLSTLRLQAQAQFEADHELLFSDLREMEGELLSAHLELEAKTLAWFEATQEKKPVKEVQVKLFKVIDYDPKEALKWALDKKMAVVLDKKEFGKLMDIARELPDFVNIRFEPRVQFASNGGEQS